jgi:hypothetical protein
VKNLDLPARTTASTTPPAASTTTATPASAPAAKAAASTTRRFRTRFVYINRPAVHFGAIQLGDSRFRVALFSHFDEGKTARLAGIAIRHDVDPLDIAVLGEGGVQVFLGGLVAEVPDKDIGHQKCSLGNWKQVGSKTLAGSAMDETRYFERNAYRPGQTGIGATLGSVGAFQ